MQHQTYRNTIQNLNEGVYEVKIKGNKFKMSVKWSWNVGKYFDIENPSFGQDVRLIFDRTRNDIFFLIINALGMSFESEITSYDIQILEKIEV